jgi:hypothetical protein
MITNDEKRNNQRKGATVAPTHRLPIRLWARETGQAEPDGGNIASYLMVTATASALDAPPCFR